MEDRDAIQRCRRGEIDVFRHLVHRYQRRALAHARALTGNDADAADMVQAAFLDSFRSLERFDANREFYPWFYVLLRNRCFKHRARVADRSADPVPDEIASRDGASAEERFDLRQALGRLEPADREVLVLKHLDGWTYDELAERLGIPRGTVMSRLFHARRRLRQLLGGQPGDPCRT
jgi:RNA polymerase sigma-70 factor (ECF subfamily)